MRRLTFSLALLLSLGLSVSARADTLFALTNGTFQSGATIAGTITINTTTGQFVSANLTYSLGGVQAVFNGPFANWGETFDMNQFFGDIYDANGDLFLIDLPVPWIMHYTGGPICSDANLCNDFSGYFQSVNGDIDPATNGLLVPVPTATAPEPSSFVFLATGLSTALGFASRKHRRLKQV